MGLNTTRRCGGFSPYPYGLPCRSYRLRNILCRIDKVDNSVKAYNMRMPVGKRERKKSTLPVCIPQRGKKEKQEIVGIRIV